MPVRIRARFIWTVVLAIVFISTGLSAGADAAPRFGTTPYNDARASATVHKPSNLTVDQFTAMVLAVTWPEIADNVTSRLPDPLAMGRSDRGPELYSGYAARAFHHSGNGAWQLDITGVGMSLNLEAMVGTDTASNAAAAEMKGRWATANTLWNSTTDPTGSERRKYTWDPWKACFRGGQNCEVIYQALTSTTPLNIDATGAVNRYGGGVTGTCYWPGDPIGFHCFKYDHTLAQGDWSYWRSTPWTGDGSISPLMARAYGWSNPSGEIRWWNGVDIGRSDNVFSLRSTSSDIPGWYLSAERVCFNAPCS